MLPFVKQYPKPKYQLYIYIAIVSTYDLFFFPYFRFLYKISINTYQELLVVIVYFPLGRSIYLSFIAKMFILFIFWLGNFIHVFVMSGLHPFFYSEFTLLLVCFVWLLENRVAHFLLPALWMKNEKWKIEK